jgi:hypothetical protein
MEIYARRCDATGVGMNEGYVVGAGDLHFSEKKYLLDHLRGIEWIDCNGENSLAITNDDDLIEFFYNEEYCYYTEWEENDDDVYYDEDGNEYNYERHGENN